MRYIFSIWITLFLIANLSCQTYSEVEKLQGYAIHNNEVTFILDPMLYSVDPHQVVITGSFRNWDKDMENSEWKLKKTNDLWTLTVNNEQNEIISPGDEFKFRADDGDWLSPPANAKNERSGNLVFEPAVVVNSLKAEIRGPYTIRARSGGKRPLQKAAYRVTNAVGIEIPIARIDSSTVTETTITTAEPMDVKRVYFLEIPKLKLKAFCSYDGWFRETYSAKELGANIDDDVTTIRLFAPRAEMVKLYLYKGKDDSRAYLENDMIRDKDGVWETIIEENLHGVYYDFTVHGSDDPGNHFYGTNPVHLTDPYARVSDNTWGKGRIWKRTTPATALKNGIPKMEDVIAYEVHVQDFTDLLPVDDKFKGTLTGMVQGGLRNSRGEKIGFDYLRDLGINTVHLMPVQEYVHFPDDDWRESFKDDPYMIEQGVSEENYQWGYRTSQAFAVESKYRVKGGEPGAQRDEFRDLVQAFHNRDMAVIIDIVPNHTAENMNVVQWYFNFNGIDMMYYYRTKDFHHIGEYGNEVKTENRPMVRRWLIDQCKHFIEEFGIDGFRIDLAGQIDQQSLIALKEALGPNIIVYGEAWIGSQDPDFEANPDWDWYKEDSPITFFQDDSRNAFKGPVFELKDKNNDRGWPGGKFDERENVKKGLANKFKEDKTPLSGINYLDSHDNFALADQFAAKDFDGRYSVDQDPYKLAATLLFTSLGPLMMHGGSEMMRSKAAAPLKEVVKTTRAGYKIHMHGKRDTYNHRMANQFIWENAGARPSDGNKNDYKNMYEFWRGLIAFRSSDYGRVFRVADSIPDDYYQWISPKDESLLGYIVKKRIFVLMNAGTTEQLFTDINLPKGEWKLIGNNEAVDHIRGVKDEEQFMLLSGGAPLKILMGPQNLKIWVRK